MTSAGGSAVTLTNGIVDVVVSVAFGPRVLRYGFVGGANIFAEEPKPAIHTALGPWHPRGGHRLWVSPESMPGSYAPDDDRVTYEQPDDLGASFRQSADAAGIEKQLAVRLSATGSRATVTHRITNRTYWPIRVAPWAITAVTPRATAVIPQPPFRSHAVDLLPARPLVQWSFTDFTDPRWSIGARLVRLRPDSGRREPQKVGAGNADGWCAVVADDGRVFVKRFEWTRGVEYPDFGCNTEVFTAGDYLEVETLGSLHVLQPGDSADHVEKWDLFAETGVSGAHQSDQSLHEALLALVGTSRRIP